MIRNSKRILRLVLIVAAGICLSAAVANWAKAQDRATVVPGMKVLFENDCVRVQYHDVAVGGKVPMHSHPAYIVYTLKPFKARITLPDGTQRISEHKAGGSILEPTDYTLGRKPRERGHPQPDSRAETGRKVPVTLVFIAVSTD